MKKLKLALALLLTSATPLLADPVADAQKVALFAYIASTCVLPKLDTANSKHLRYSHDVLYILGNMKDALHISDKMIMILEPWLDRSVQKLGGAAAFCQKEKSWFDTIVIYYTTNHGGELNDAWRATLKGG